MKTELNYANWTDLDVVRHSSTEIPDTRPTIKYTITIELDICREEVYVCLKVGRYGEFAQQHKLLTSLGLDGLEILTTTQTSECSIEFKTLGEAIRAADALEARIVKFAETVVRLDREAFEASLSA
jgi:hypothetical protein